MIQEKVCLTPDSWFHINITANKIEVSVDLPIDLNLSEANATELENNLHDAVESVLAKYFV